MTCLLQALSLCIARKAWFFIGGEAVTELFRWMTGCKHRWNNPWLEVKVGVRVRKRVCDSFDIWPRLSPSHVHCETLWPSIPYRLFSILNIHHLQINRDDKLDKFFSSAQCPSSGKGYHKPPKSHKNCKTLTSQPPPENTDSTRLDLLNINL